MVPCTWPNLDNLEHLFLDKARIALAGVSVGGNDAEAGQGRLHH